MPFKSRAQRRKCAALCMRAHKSPSQKAWRKMRSLTLFALVLMFAACSSQEAQQETVDTVMVFTATPSRGRSDSAARAQSMNEIMAALNAYSDHKVSADSAAKVIVAYQRKSGRSLNIVMDAQLIAAVRREQERKK